MAANAEKKHRTDALENRELSPDSLVGSYFLGNDTKQWQGVVVAEPAPGIYLVERFSRLVPGSIEQILVRIEDMMDWHFYDDADWMSNAYRQGFSRRWEQLGERDK